jgi:hypothetical protein
MNEQRMTLPKPKQWEPLAAIPIFAGLYWLLAASGGHWLFWGLVPGALMLMGGMALLLMPGDLRITEYMAAGAALGLLFVLPVLVTGGMGDAFLGALTAAGAFLTAGHIALAREPASEGAPQPVKDLMVDAKAAIDEVLLAYFVGAARIPDGDQIIRLGEDAQRLEDLIKSRGWLDQPETMHPAPPVPERVYVQQARIYGHTYERVSYPSAFTADPALPGAEIWSQHQNNNQSIGWLMRHPGAPRPWLLCIHGYRMGEAWMDFGLFAPRWLHERLGLNLFMPVLPLHGPRRVGLRSGDQFLDGNPLDLLYAEMQALWDLRRALAWLRGQEDGARIGVLGYSLGGYNAALLAQYERDLEFVVAGIPPTDFAAAIWRHTPPAHRDYLMQHGLSLDRYRTLLKPVSPVARPPLIDRDRLYIFAGAADRVVLPDQSVALGRHWQVPIQWYQGAHLTFRNEEVVRAHIEAAMQRAGWPISPEFAPAR